MNLIRIWRAWRPRDPRAEIPEVVPGVVVRRILGDVDELMPDAWTGASIRDLVKRGAARDEYPDWDPSYDLAEPIAAPYDAPDVKRFDPER